MHFRYVVVVIPICLPCLIKIPNGGGELGKGSPKTAPKGVGSTPVWEVLCKGMTGGRGHLCLASHALR